MFHWVAHLLGWNGGRVVSKYDEDGVLWIGFQCEKCSRVQGAAPVDMRFRA